MIQRMKMKVITMMTIMHEIKEICILFTKSVLADCLSLTYCIRAECLLHINVSFSNHTQLNYDLSFIICHFDQNVFMSCMYISLTLCYIRYLSLTRTEVFNPKGKYWFIFVSQGTSLYECKLGDII